MRSIRIAVLVALSLVLLPALLSAQNLKINHAGGSEQRPIEVERQVSCTSYPEWMCFPSGSPAKPDPAEERASREVKAPRDAASIPACTAYPEWTCFPEANEVQGSKVVHAKKTKQQPSSESKPAAGLPGGGE